MNKRRSSFFPPITELFRFTILLIACMTVLTGCGTITTMSKRENVLNPTYIYKGTRAEIGLLATSSEVGVPGWQKVLLIIDLPLSLCADTLVLPYTGYQAGTADRIIAVWFIPENDEGITGINIDSDVSQEQRHAVKPTSACEVLNRITQPTKILLSAHNNVPLKDFGMLYETINSNQYLRLFYQPNAIERNLLDEYLQTKK